MQKLFLLKYDKSSIGIYNKMSYLLDYVLELTNFPFQKINLFKFEINIFEINIGYPKSVIVFSKENDKLFLKEQNGKKLELNMETFSKFKLIQKYFYNKFIKNKEEVSENKENINIELTEEKKKVIEEEKKRLLENKEKLAREQKEIVSKMNRMKFQIKIFKNWNQQFNTDIDLFYKFKDKIKEEDGFEIPELFKEKNEFFKQKESELDDIKDSFTDYFKKFNPTSDINIDEMINLLESDSESENNNYDTETTKDSDSDTDTDSDSNSDSDSDSESNVNINK